MKKICFILLLLTGFISCGKKEEIHFSLTGKTDDIANGQYLYLHDLANNVTLDSAKVENNSFRFTTKLADSPYLVILHPKKRMPFKEIWLEDTTMTFNSTSTDFKDAIITGSKTNDIITKFEKNTSSLTKQEIIERDKKFIKEHPKSVLSAYFLTFLSDSYGKTKTKEIYDNFPKKIQKGAFGQRVLKYLETAQTPEPGEQFVDFTMENPQGDEESLSDLKGKVVLLEFWASWCKPCRASNPELVKTYKKYHDKGFGIFAVSLDTNKDLWTTAIKKDGLNWHQVSDLQDPNTAAEIYGVPAIPTNFLFNRDGKLVATNLYGNSLNAKLNEMMSK